MNNTYDIFRIPVYEEDTNLDNEAMAEYSLSFMKDNPGRVLSNEGGWQSNNLQGSHVPLNELFKTITVAINNFASQLFLPEQKIDNIWININGYKDYNIEHKHPNSYLSGVYYVQTHENCGHITFKNPCADIIEGYWSPHTIGHDDNKLNLSWWFPAETGKMYIFPSWLGHKVGPNLDKNKKRISISWNSCINE